MVKILGFAAIVLSSWSLAHAAPPRLDALAISPADAGLALGCAADQTCVELVAPRADCEAGQACPVDGKDWSLRLTGGPYELAPPLPYRLTDLLSPDEEPSFELWPKFIRFPGGVLLGVRTQTRTLYSGGGGSATTLHLIAFVPGQAPLRVLSIDERAQMMIRACFNERDMKRRAGACHDQYTYRANLALTGAYAGGLPVLRYRSQATTFPGVVSRSTDSLQRPPLHTRDVVTVTDRQCSYARTYRFNPGIGSYATDKPLPDCSDYTSP